MQHALKIKVPSPPKPTTQSSKEYPQRFIYSGFLIQTSVPRRDWLGCFWAVPGSFEAPHPQPSQGRQCLPRPQSAEGGVTLECEQRHLKVPLYPALDMEVAKFLLHLLSLVTACLNRQGSQRNPAGQSLRLIPTWHSLTKLTITHCIIKNGFYNKF